MARGDESARQSRGGLNMVEFTVVAAIIAVLAALAAVAVLGATSTVARSRDISSVQEAVDRFRSETAIYPTTSGTTADGGGVEGTDYFRVVEGAGGVDFDVNDDGDAAGTINVVPIDWDVADPNDPEKVFGDYIAKPRHAAPTGPITINAEGSVNSVVTEAWVVDDQGTVRVLVPKSLY